MNARCTILFEEGDKELARAGCSTEHIYSIKLYEWVCLVKGYTAPVFELREFVMIEGTTKIDRRTILQDHQHRASVLRETINAADDLKAYYERKLRGVKEQP